MKAVILAGGQETGRCPLSIIRPRPLFPIPDKVLLNPLLRALKSIDIEEAIICANGKTRILRDHFDRNPNSHIDLGFHDDHLPRGTAGCVRDLADQLRDDSFLVIEGGLFIDGGLQELIATHQASGGAITVAAVSVQQWYSGNGNGSTDNGHLGPLGVYVIEPDVLDHIPTHSYFDIKEQLLPKLAGYNLPAVPVRFHGKHRRINSAGRYTMLVREMLYKTVEAGGEDLVQLREGVWADPTAYVAPSATLLGPVVVGAHSVIGENVLVTGPTLIGGHVKIDDQATITSSIIWPGATVGLGAKVTDSIITDGFRVNVFSHLADSVAIDKKLRSGDLHGLETGGYQIDKLRSNGLPGRKSFLGTIASAIRKISNLFI